jgi:SP family myo-inositol transporter-like MFS transporter 13
MVVGITLNAAKTPEEEEEEKEDAGNQRLTFEVIKMVFLSAIGGFLFGYDTGIVSGAMVFIRDDFELNDIWQEVIISITILGAWIFSILSGSLSDYIGRKRVVIISSIVFTAGSLLMGIAPDKYTLLVGRLIVGAGIGLSSMIIPL